MKLHMRERVISIIAYGAIWGILEATLGYVLHFLPALIAGTIMFPFVAGILVSAYKNQHSRMDILGIAIVAAAIKSINLWMPQYSIFKTINPMMSIIFEALAVICVVSAFDRSKLFAKVGWLIGASLIWRGLYLGYMGVQFWMTGFLSAHLTSIESMMQFGVYEAALSGGMAFVIVALFALVRDDFKPIFMKPWLSLPLLGLSMALTILL